MGIVLNVSENSKMMTRILRRGTNKMNVIGMMILAMAVMFLSACNATTPAMPLTSPLSSPLALSSSLSFAKPNAGKGAATGRLITMVNGQETGYVGGDLFLAGFLVGSKPEAPPMVSFSVDSSPKAVMYQADGQFAFTNIAPGTYTLIVWNPSTSFIVENPGKGAVTVVIEADKVTKVDNILVP
jgi:hypothetical protein